MKLREWPGKAARFIFWRVYLGLSLPALANRLSNRWGWAARRVLHAVPGSPPYRRSRLHLSRNYGLGDVLMCTPAIRELKRRNPACHVTFYTDFPELLAGLPFIDDVRRSGEEPDGAIGLKWQTFRFPDTPREANWRPWHVAEFPRRHLARIIGDQLGVDVRDVRPSCMLDVPERDRLRASWQHLPRPWILLNRHASGHTPNKAWPEEHWEALIDGLLAWASVIEIGMLRHADPGRDPGRYLSLIGRLSLTQMVAAIAAADLHVGPISGPTHVAAAFEVPAVVIYGGREPPVCTHYEKNIGLYSAVPCSPCWMVNPCPYERKCLHQIAPAAVEAALKGLWGAGPASDPIRSVQGPGVRAAAGRDLAVSREGPIR